MNEPCVFIVDDDHAVLEATKAVVESTGRHAMTFSSAESFLDFVTIDHSGCLVTDYRLDNGMYGLELQKTLKKRGILLPVIVVTAYGKVPIAVRAMKQGAVTLLEKPTADSQLTETIEEALERDKVQRKNWAKKQRIRRCILSLKQQEYEVMGMVIDGLPNKAISSRLGISVRTVESRRSKVFEKMGVPDANVAQLVRKTCFAGLHEIAYQHADDGMAMDWGKESGMGVMDVDDSHPITPPWHRLIRRPAQATGG